MTLSLIAPVHEILEKVRQATSKEIQFIEREDLPTYAALRMARADTPSPVILVKREHDEIINHLIAHECGMEPTLYVNRRSLIDPETRSHEIFQSEVLGNHKGFPGLVEHLDPVQGEYPDLVSHVVEADQAEMISRPLTSFIR